MTTRVITRLLPSEAAMLPTLQAALATPLMPRVTHSDVLRAGLLALQERIGALGARA